MKTGRSGKDRRKVQRKGSAIRLFARMIEQVGQIVKLGKIRSARVPGERGLEPIASGAIEPPAKMILCIPGPWEDRGDFLRQVVTLEPNGRYMFLGMFLGDVADKDQVGLEFFPPDPHIPRAFEVGGKGRLSTEVIAQIHDHRSVVYLRFPLNVRAQRERIVKFTQLLRRLGGVAVKVEGCGLSHTWETWFDRLEGSPFDLYFCTVVMIIDDRCYYSCGMHHFGLPECEIPTSIPAVEAANLVERFNLFQIEESPILASGQTFSLSADAPHFRLSLSQDHRHEPEILFHNPHGVWRLEEV